MYEKNELLKIINDYKVDDKTFLKKNTLVQFLKAIDTKDITKSYVLVQHKDKQLLIPELIVVPTKTNLETALKNLNNKLVENDEKYGIYHHNFFVRAFYKIKFFFCGFYKKSKQQDLSRLKKILNDDSQGDFNDYQ